MVTRQMDRVAVGNESSYVGWASFPIRILMDHLFIVHLVRDCHYAKTRVQTHTVVHVNSGNRQ